MISAKLVAPNEPMKNNDCLQTNDQGWNGFSGNTKVILVQFSS